MPNPESVPSVPGSLLHAIATRSLVERARGVLMWRLDLGPEAAAEMLARWSDEAGVDLMTLSDSLVNVVCLPDHQRARDLALLRRLQDNLRRDDGKK